jgi:hypothetical protein
VDTSIRLISAPCGEHSAVLPFLRQSVPVTGNQDVQEAPEHVAALLRERIYGGIACLSTLLLLLRYPEDEQSAWPIVVDVVVATGSLWAASLLADVVAHLAAHGSAPRGAEARRMFRESVQILEAAVIPVAMLVASGLGVLMTERAIRFGVWVSVVQLGLFALLAARRTDLAWWKRYLLVAALLGLGALVVLLKTFAH